MTMRKNLIFALLISLLFCFVSCSQFIDMDVEDTGRHVDRDALEGEKETADMQSIIYEDSIDHKEKVFYWTENGSVFHSVPECSALSNSHTVICGNLKHAVGYGIIRSCSRCFEKT